MIIIIPAHINNNNIEQSVADHCRETAFYASSEGEKLGLKNSMMLAGLLHDIGKNTLNFDSYIRNAHQGKAVSHKQVVKHIAAVVRAVCTAGEQE